MSHGITRVSTGIPGYGLRTEMIRKFFPFPLWKRFRKTGIPERFFPLYGNFRNIVPELQIVTEFRTFQKFSGNYRFPEHLVPELH